MARWWRRQHIRTPSAHGCMVTTAWQAGLLAAVRALRLCLSEFGAVGDVGPRWCRVGPGRPLRPGRRGGSRYHAFPAAVSAHICLSLYIDLVRSYFGLEEKRGRA
eukprot:6401405-Pyramimonas_sp.AAC.1